MTALATPYLEHAAPDLALLRPEPITPEEMLEMHGTKHAELVDGELLEKSAMSLESGHVSVRASRFIAGHVDLLHLGLVADGQASYQ